MAKEKPSETFPRFPIKIAGIGKKNRDDIWFDVPTYYYLNSVEEQIVVAESEDYMACIELAGHEWLVDSKVQCILARMPNLAVRLQLAENPNVVGTPAESILLTDNIEQVRIAMAENRKAEKENQLAKISAEFKEKIRKC